ncbi:MAG: proteasome subunit beta [Bifidobacteriaceae bacterium]|jgi:proteasome beta subunit|nr:proteasome subunit beta [Bifidobacteriaceae bacterium]
MRFPDSYFEVGSSFLEFVRHAAPETLTAALDGRAVDVAAAPTGTTVVALTYGGGLVVAGDRRATVGTQIASREIEKVYPADSHSAIGVAGTAGLAIELVRLFQLELEHYEKIEGNALSLNGKANRLATLVRGSLGLAMRGLAAVPVFGGWDAAAAAPRIFSYDVTGGRYEEREYYAIGSGAVFARGSLKKLWHPGQDASTAVTTAIAALIDASDDDAATAGPDVGRAIWPVVARVDAAGYQRIADSALGQVVADLFAQRRNEVTR